MGSIPPEAQPRLGKRNAESNVQLYADEIRDTVNLPSPRREDALATHSHEITVSRNALLGELQVNIADHKQEEEEEEEEEKVKDNNQDQRKNKEEGNGGQLKFKDKSKDKDKDKNQGHILQNEQQQHQQQLQEQLQQLPPVNVNGIKVEIPVEPFTSPKPGAAAPRTGNFRPNTDIRQESIGSVSSISSTRMTPRSGNNGWPALQDPTHVDVSRNDDSIHGSRRDSFVVGIADILPSSSNHNSIVQSQIIRDLDQESGAISIIGLSNQWTDLESQFNDLRQQVDQKNSQIEKLNQDIQRCVSSKNQLATLTSHQIQKLDKAIHLLLNLPVERFAERERIVQE
ncbi:hypothetical protein RFI_14400, partial [Reticulomyxa filosa]